MATPGKGIAFSGTSIDSITKAIDETYLAHKGTAGVADATVAWNLIQHSPRSHAEIWDHAVRATEADPTWGGFLGNVEAWLLAMSKGTFPPARR